MKCIVIVSLFFSSFFLGAEENESKLPQSIHIYLCSRLTEAAKQWNNEITQEFDEEFDIFRPQDIDISYYPLKEQDFVAYVEDIKGMKKSDLLLRAFSLKRFDASKKLSYNTYATTIVPCGLPSLCCNPCGPSYLFFN